jgi:ribosomal protein S20
LVTGVRFPTDYKISKDKKNNKMANHKSALKRIRSNEKRRVLNRYQHKTTRNAIKALRIATDKTTQNYQAK